MKNQSGPAVNAGMQILKPSNHFRKCENFYLRGNTRKPRYLHKKGSWDKNPIIRLRPTRPLEILHLTSVPQKGFTDYSRELDIEEAIAKVSYKAGQVNFLREVFSSAPGQSIVIRLTADKPGALTFTARLSRRGGKPSFLPRETKYF